MAEWWAPHVPNHKLLTAKEMKKAIGQVVRMLMEQAHLSAYDVDVCVRSVQATNEAFKAVPVTGTASEYGLAVAAALSPVEKSFWDETGEHTSRGMVGSLGSDIALILRTQDSDEILDCDRGEARECLTQELTDLMDLFPVWTGEKTDSDVETIGSSKFREVSSEPKPLKLFQIKGMVFGQDEGQETVIKAEVTGASGTPYFVKTRISKRSKGAFVIEGTIYSTKVCQFPILQKRMKQQISSED